MPLEPAAVVDIATLCAPAVPPATLLAIARVESGLEPLAIGVNGGGRRPRPRTRKAAVRDAERLIAAGRNIDLGLGQINVRNLGWLGLSVADAFDPCRNLAAAADVLTDGYRRAAARLPDGPGRLRAALSFYNTGHPSRGLANGYVDRVVAAAGGDLPAPSPPGGPPGEPGQEPPAWDVFGRARLGRATLHFEPAASAGAAP